MAIKVDLEKAYDRISWSFLRKVLVEVGLGKALLDFVMFCITSASLSVLWNGEKLDAFVPQRGLRQGDPLSPYLFVLCMEVLGQRIRRESERGAWKGVKASRTGPRSLGYHICFLQMIYYCLARQHIDKHWW